ncbi:hypothetical protein GCM10023149_37910 [Mucilaginibacter gynuensis]|uniref:MobA/VirD2-like nuclease domain-containing protein n=1 Tax=Mucilaginibacter gynuensis TaxID=1302236 RepID=A0ABP8GYQ8_9SPHI
MNVRILEKSQTFRGVFYNLNKIEKQQAELLYVHKFGALQALSALRKQDYVNYLKANSALNAHIRYPQFHAIISCRGRSQDKVYLKSLGEQWMKAMGYGDQPYLLFFHKDTANNHLHIVSTRIGRDGKKIAYSFERIRSVQALHILTGIDVNRQLNKAIELVSSYSLADLSDFGTLMNTLGYRAGITGEEYQIYKFGIILSRIPLHDVIRQVGRIREPARIETIRRAIETAKLCYDPRLYPLTYSLAGHWAEIQTGYSSPMADFLKYKYGLEVIYHTRHGYLPHDLTIIDHHSKAVFAGKEIIPLRELIVGNNVATDLGQEFTSLSFPVRIATDIDDDAIHGPKRRRKRKH